MKKSFSARSHSMSGVFIFFLIGIFAIMSVLLVLMGVRVYRSVTEAANENTDYQLALSYLCNKVHAYDHGGGAEVTEMDGRQVLCLKESIEGERYETRIFFNGQYICELFAAEEDDFDPDLGQELTQVKAMQFSSITPNRLQVDVTLPDGSAHTMHMTLRSSQTR